MRRATPLAIASALPEGLPAKTASTALSACARDHQINSTGAPPQKPETRFAGPPCGPHVPRFVSPHDAASEKQSSRSTSSSVTNSISMSDSSFATPRHASGENDLRDKIRQRVRDRLGKRTQLRGPRSRHYTLLPIRASRFRRSGRSTAPRTRARRGGCSEKPSPLSDRVEEGQGRAAGAARPLRRRSPASCCPRQVTVAGIEVQLGAVEPRGLPLRVVEQQHFGHRAIVTPSPRSLLCSQPAALGGQPRVLTAPAGPSAMISGGDGRLHAVPVGEEEERFPCAS